MCKLELMAGFLMSGTTLMARMQLYGVEQALVSTAVEFAMRAVRTAKDLVPNLFGNCR